MERARGPTQATCRSDAIGATICQEGHKLPAAWRENKPEGATWGQYDQLMHDLARDVVDSERCANFHRVAPWIFQWCHHGDYALLDEDPEHAADTGDLADAIALGADYGTPSVPLVGPLPYFASGFSSYNDLRAQLCIPKRQVWHYGHGYVKEERVKHAGHALVVQRALGTDFQKDLDQIVSKSHDRES